MRPGNQISLAARRAFQEGESAVLIEPRGNQHFLRLRRGAVFFHRRTGYLRHDDIIDALPGFRLKVDDEREVVCLRPTLEDYLLKRLKRQTAVLYPKDLGVLTVVGNLFPGARVLEAGIGSGAAALTLLRFLGPEGVLYSYERRAEIAEAALANLKKAHDVLGDSGATHHLRIRDVYDGIEETDLDLILTDVPQPHRLLEAGSGALRPGGTLLCWLPSVTQCYKLVRHLQRSDLWAEIRTLETLSREWHIGPRTARPRQRMVGHTGFWVRARRVDLIVQSAGDDQKEEGSKRQPEP